MIKLGKFFKQEYLSCFVSNRRKFSPPSSLPYPPSRLAFNLSSFTFPLVKRKEIDLEQVYSNPSGEQFSWHPAELLDFIEEAAVVCKFNENYLEGVSYVLSCFVLSSTE